MGSQPAGLFCQLHRRITIGLRGPSGQVLAGAPEERLGHPVKDHVPGRYPGESGPLPLMSPYRDQQSGQAGGVGGTQLHSEAPCPGPQFPISVSIASCEEGEVNCGRSLRTELSQPQVSAVHPSREVWGAHTQLQPALPVGSTPGPNWEQTLHYPPNYTPISSRGLW